MLQTLQTQAFFGQEVSTARWVFKPSNIISCSPNLPRTLFWNLTAIPQVDVKVWLSSLWRHLWQSTAWRINHPLQEQKRPKRVLESEKWETHLPDLPFAKEAAKPTALLGAAFALFCLASAFLLAVSPFSPFSFSAFFDFLVSFSGASCASFSFFFLFAPAGSPAPTSADAEAVPFLSPLSLSKAADKLASCSSSDMAANWIFASSLEVVPCSFFLFFSLVGMVSGSGILLAAASSTSLRSSFFPMAFFQASSTAKSHLPKDRFTYNKVQTHMKNRQQRSML